MPDLYAKLHDGFINNYNNTNEKRLLNKKVILPIKNKMNYIQPVNFIVSTFNSIVYGLQFIATITLEKQFKSTAYILIEKENGYI